MSSNFNMNDYKDVATRIADFRAKHPEGCLRPADVSIPYRLELIDGHMFIVYVAAAYRTPDDPTPGIGVAYEPVPGRTSFTKDSELQNAETAAWGRAIIAVLASESKHIASREEVQGRQEREQGKRTCAACGDPIVGPAKLVKGSSLHPDCVAS